MSQEQVSWLKSATKRDLWDLTGRILHGKTKVVVDMTVAEYIAAIHKEWRLHHEISEASLQQAGLI